MLFQQIFPDETLFSVSCRYHMRCPGRIYKRRKTSTALPGLHWLLPENIRWLSNELGESVDALLKHHNLCLFKLTLGQNQFTKLIKGVEQGVCIGTLMQLTRIPSSHFASPPILQFCDTCRKEDVERYGISYWHSAHQLPGVTMCQLHGEGLYSIRWEEWRSQPFTPCMCTSFFNKSSSTTQAMKFSVFVQQVFDWLRNNEFNQPMSSVITSRLSERGLMLSKSRVDREKVQLKLHEFLSDVLLSEIPCTDIDVSRVIHVKNKYQTHPLKILILLGMLFETKSSLMDAFFQKRAAVQKVVTQSPVLNFNKQVCDLYRLGLSINAISNKIYRSRCYVKRVLRQENLIDGIKTCIGRKSYEKALKLLRLGLKTENIASELGLLHSQVERVISETKGLAAFRKKLRTKQRKDRYRIVISDYINSKGPCGRTQLKANRYKEYSWLYTNDRDWLFAQIPFTQHPFPPNLRTKLNDNLLPRL